MNIYFSQFWRLGSPGSWYQQSWCLVRASWFIDGPFSLFPNMVEGAGELCGVSFIRALNPIQEGSPHDLSTTQRPYLPIPSYWALGFQRMNFWGGNNIQAVAGFHWRVTILKTNLTWNFIMELYIPINQHIGNKAPFCIRHSESLSWCQILEY